MYAVVLHVQCSKGADGCFGVVYVDVFEGYNIRHAKFWSTGFTFRTIYLLL